MTYVALLRGINVGGKASIQMARLKLTFENLGFDNVKTFINSGNVIFTSDKKDSAQLVTLIEKAVKTDFGLAVPVTLRNINQMDVLMKELPEDWLNDNQTKCDVLFLWDEIDSPDALQFVQIKPEIEDLLYVPGALLWRIGREHINRGSMLKLVGTEPYKKMTIRNPNSVRKIYALMQAADQASDGSD